MKLIVAALTVSILILGTTAVPAQEIAGKGSMGASAGVIKYNAGDDWSDGSSRLSGQASFRYGLNNSWSLQLEAGGAWNNNGAPVDAAQDGGNDILTVVFPATLGLLYRTQLSDTNFYPHLGIGAGFYRMGVKDSYRHYADAPATGETMLWTSFGGYGKIGTDYFFTDSVSMNFDFVYTQIGADEGDRYQPSPDDISRFTDENVSYLQFRTGVNYFFNLGGGGEPEPMTTDDEEDN